MSFVHNVAIDASVKLSEKRGTPPSFEESTYNRSDKPRLREHDTDHHRSYGDYQHYFRLFGAG